MSAIEIRSAITDDINALVRMCHSVETVTTWQMDPVVEPGNKQVFFNRIRLPRPVKVEYPKDPVWMIDQWTRKDLFLVARIRNERGGYLTLDLIEKRCGRVTDLVVDETFRRQGVATALLLAAQDWLKTNGINRILLELQVKNQAAIGLAEKMGYAFCGFMDGHFSNREIALFYANTFR